MNRSCLALFSGVGLAVAALPAAANDAAWSLRGTLGMQQYELGFEDVVTPLDPALGAGEIQFRDGFEVNDSVSLGGVGLQVTFGKFFVDISGQWSGDGDDAGEQFQGANPFPGVGANHAFVANFDRQELNATVGYGVTSSLSVFFGYKNAEANLRNTLSLTGSADLGDVIFDGDRVIDFSYDGAVLGTSFAVPVDAWYGAFAVQAAVAYLDGEFRDRFVGETSVVLPAGPLPVPLAIDSEISGDSVGVNVGIAWVGRFGKGSERLSYTIGLDHSQYEFDTSQTNTGNFEEKNTRLRIDLRYRF